MGIYTARSAKPGIRPARLKISKPFFLHFSSNLTSTTNSAYLVQQLTKLETIRQHDFECVRFEKQFRNQMILVKGYT